MKCEWIEPVGTSQGAKRSIFRQDYRRCTYNSLDIVVGDFVFVSGYTPKNRDPNETADDWDIAEVLHLYDLGNDDDPPRERASVRWYTRVRALPRRPLLSSVADSRHAGWPALHDTCEVVHDTRPFGAEVLLNCVMAKCQVHVVACDVSAEKRVGRIATVDQCVFAARFRYQHAAKPRLFPLLSLADSLQNGDTNNNNNKGEKDNETKDKDVALDQSPVTPSRRSRVRTASRWSTGNYRSLADGDADWKDYNGLVVSYTSPDKLRMRIRCSESPKSRYSPSVQSPLVNSPADRVRRSGSRRQILSDRQQQQSSPSRRQRGRTSLLPLDEVDEPPEGSSPRKALGADSAVKRRLLQFSESESPIRKRARANAASDDENESVLSPVKRGRVNSRRSLPAGVFSAGDNCDASVRSPSRRKSTAAASPGKRGRHTLQSPEKSTEVVASSPSRTPKRGRRHSLCSPSVSSRTPRTPRGRHTPAALSPCTPLSLSRTPGTLSSANTPLQLARRQLHVAAVPQQLPCRQAEFMDIRTFIVNKLTASDGGCMYVSGVPGTGKTATMREVVRSLNKDVENGELPDFQFIEVNGMRLTEPHRVYSQILLELSGERATPDHAATLLDKRFSGGRGGRQLPIVLLVDELDLLWTRKQEVLYNLFDWPSRAEARLIVIAIANTMDLPERVMQHRVSSRLGLTRRTFLPYTYKQLQQIVETRLAGLEAFDPDAIQLVARKVAAVSGDARRALDICRRSTEIAEPVNYRTGRDKGDHRQLVTMSHVNQAVHEMFSAPKIVAIRSCSVLEKTLLRAIVMEFQRTGLEEARFSMVHDHLTTICRYEDIVPPNISDTFQLIFQLGSSRLLTAEPGITDRACRIRLNVLADDVTYAVRDSENDASIGQ